MEQISTSVAEYSATAAALAELAKKYKGATFEVTTKDGMKAARAARLELTSLRVALEKKRVEIKAPVLLQARLIDSEAQRITKELALLEDPIDEQIKVVERAEAERKAAAEKAEQERLAAIERDRKEAEEKRLAEERAKLEAEKAELNRQQAAHREAAAKAQREQDERERQARLKIEEEERTARMRREEEDRQARAARDEADQKAKEQQGRNQAALSEIQGIQQQVIIAQCGRLGVRAGGTIKCIEETLAETEAWEIDAERFGTFHGAAVKAKAIAVDQIRAMLTAAVARAAEEARIKTERDRLDAERRALEDAARAEQFRKDEEARAVRLEEQRKREAEENARAQAEREARMKEAELLEADQMLQTFVERFGHLPQFGYIVVAIRSYLEKKAA